MKPHKESKNSDSDEESEPDERVEIELLKTLEINNCKEFDIMDEVTMFVVCNRDLGQGATFFMDRYKRIDA